MILEKLKVDLNTALKSKDSVRVLVLRSLISEMKNAEIASRPQGKELTEEDYIKVTTKEAKKHRESIEIFSQAGRDDLVQKEQAELEIINEYLPETMGEDAIKKIAENIIKENPNAQFGEVMKLVMQQTKGKADGKLVSETVKNLTN